VTIVTLGGRWGARSRSAGWVPGDPASRTSHPAACGGRRPRGQGRGGARGRVSRGAVPTGAPRGPRCHGSTPRAVVSTGAPRGARCPREHPGNHGAGGSTSRSASHRAAGRAGRGPVQSLPPRAEGSRCQPSPLDWFRVDPLRPGRGHDRRSRPFRPAPTGRSVFRAPSPPRSRRKRCSARSWSPTVVRSPSGPSVPRPNSASARLPSSRSRTGSPNTDSRPTSPMRLASGGTPSARTSTSRASSPRPRTPAPTPSTPATASCRRTPTWPRRAKRPASPSSVRTTRSSN